MKTRILVAASVVVLVAASESRAVVLGQFDNFNDNTTQNWEKPIVANVALGGPGGAADPFLQVISLGGGGPGSRMITFNQSQWSGDYAAAGVGNLSMYLNNNGNSDLYVRIAIGDSISPSSGGTWFASTDAIHLAPGSGWAPAAFSLAATDLTKIQGPLGYNDVISNVDTLRILHSTAPNATGGVIPGMLGIDNILALPIPEPSSLLLCLFAVLLLPRRRRR